MHALSGTPVTLDVTYYSGGVIADPGTVTVGVVLPDGATLEPVPEVVGTGASPRSATIPAGSTAALGAGRATWTSTTLGSVTTDVEIVGDLLFTVAEARAWPNSKVSDAEKYPAAVLERERARITDWFQRICHVAFVPRGKQIELSGQGRCHLWLPDLRVLRVQAVEVREGTAWVPFTQDELDDLIVERSGRLTRATGTPFPVGHSNVRVRYEHGHDRCPAEIRRAALLTLMDDVGTAPVSRRATQVVSPTSTEYLWTPGMRGSSVALPDVHAILEQFDERIVRA